MCLAHDNVVTNITGQEVHLKAGMVVTAYDEDADEEGKPDKILATGVVEPSPEFAQCRGSIWALRVNESGVQSESKLDEIT